LLHHFIGDGIGRLSNREENGEHAIGGKPGRFSIDGKLQQRRTGDAIAIWLTSLDHPGALQCRKVIGNHRRKHRSKLIDGCRRARFVNVDELVGLESEDFAKICPGAPAAKQIPDAGE
jgi:hypothetical protein